MTAMTDADWSAATDWREIVWADYHPDAFVRRYTLAAAAYARRLTPVTGEQLTTTAVPWQESRVVSVPKVVGLIERIADGLIPEEQETLLRYQLEPLEGAAKLYRTLVGLGPVTLFEAFTVAEQIGLDTAAELTDFLREFVGDRFLDPASLLPPRGLPGRPYDLARLMYDSSDFSRMPELATALRRRKGVHPRLLEHARRPGPHYRGCWAVDRILGLSPEFRRVDPVDIYG